MTFLLPIAVVTLVQAPAPVDAAKVSVSPPATIVEIDVGKLKGELMRLAWSPDATVLYVLTVERDTRSGSVKPRHYLLALDGTPPKGTDGEPPWAATYWTWKSAQAAPGRPALKIAVEQRQERVSSTATPMAGNMARGGSDPGGSGSGGVGVSVDEAARAAEQSQTASIFRLRLKGQVIGEFVNVPAVPGLTFGWGPSGSGLIAFANPEGRLVVMDEQGHARDVEGTKSALLPAWTSDGKRLAWLEKTGRKKAALRVADVALQ
jgi:hypothetical protein